MKKKLLALALACGMLTGALAGCGGGSDAPAGNNNAEGLFAKADDLYYGRIRADELPKINLTRFQNEKFI